MIGYKLTIEQKDMLVGNEYRPNNYFNTVQDINGDWFIFNREVDKCCIDEFAWVKDLPTYEYVPPIITAII